MKRWVPLIDVIVFAALPALFTVLIVITLFFEQPWPPPKIALAIGVPVMSWAIFGAMLWRRWTTRPTFVTLIGTAVWANGIDVTAEQVSDAINLYVYNAATAHKRLDSQTVLAMFGRMRIELTPRPIWWAGKKKAGLQKGYGIRVYWGDGFGYNAFFHECHHAVDENLLAVPVDYQHKRVAWWDLIPKIKRFWREGHKSADRV